MKRRGSFRMHSRFAGMTVTVPFCGATRVSGGSPSDWPERGNALAAALGKLGAACPRLLVPESFLNGLINRQHETGNG